MRGLRGLLDVLARAGAGIDEAAEVKLLERRPVERKTLALLVGCERAAHVRSLLPVESKPAKVFEHGADELRLGACGIEVFVAQDECASVFARAFLGCPEGQRVAEMEMARGRRREASAIGRGGDRGFRNGH